MSPAALAALLSAVGLLAAALQAVTLSVLQGIRDDAREDRAAVRVLMARVNEHEGYFAALKIQESHGGHNGKQR